MHPSLYAGTNSTSQYEKNQLRKQAAAMMPESLRTANNLERPYRKINHDDPLLIPVSDDQLVTLSQTGDQEAYTELVRRHQGTCLRVAFSILQDRPDAEDEVQNAVWKAFQHIRQFQQDSKFSTWMTRIVVNQCLMRLRKSRGVRFQYIDDLRIRSEAISVELRDWRLSPEQEIGREETAALLQREVGRIPPLLRTVFLLRDVEHLPIQDVADRLGITVAAAKSRLLRARTELRGRLTPYFGRVGPAMLMA